MAKRAAEKGSGAARDPTGMGSRTCGGEARASPPKTNRGDCRLRLGRTSGLALLAAWAILSSCLSSVSLAAPSHSSQLAFRRTMGSEGSIRRKVNSHRFSLDNHASHRSVLLFFAPPLTSWCPCRPNGSKVPSLFCNLGVEHCTLDLSPFELGADTIKGPSTARAHADLVDSSPCAPRACGWNVAAVLPLEKFATF